jgi:hypothetical protein
MTLEATCLSSSSKHRVAFTEPMRIWIESSSSFSCCVAIAGFPLESQCAAYFRFRIGLERGEGGCKKD